MAEKDPQVIEESILYDGLIRADASSAELPEKVFFRIGEVSRFVGVAPSVVRFWETEFKLIKPARSRSKQRLYRQKDVGTLLLIKSLLYEQRFTLEGAKKHLSKFKRGVPLQEKLNAITIDRLIADLKEIKLILSR